MIDVDDDVKALATAVRDALTSLWGDATAAETSSLAPVADKARQLGWFDLGGEDSLAFAVAAIRETGRVSCPLPIIDSFVAERLGHEATDLVAIVPEDDDHDHIDAGDVIGSVLVLPATGSTVTQRGVRDAATTPGIAAPLWWRLVLDDARHQLKSDKDRVADALSLLRLGLAVRALSAAGRTHELALEHAKTRHQFGRPIGQFGAVQQRLAAREIELRSANALIDEAVGLHDRQNPAWSLAAEIAVTRIADVASEIQLDAQHTLGAVGFFEEHQAPWLFRRVHADLTRIASFRTPGSQLGDRLAEGANLPALSASEISTSFREELRELFQQYRTIDKDGSTRYDDDAVLAAMVDRGLFGMGWPKEFGGRNATMAEQVALTEAITYYRVPAFVQMGSVAMLGNTIVEHGTKEQKERYLPLVRRGEMRFCLGYSEPESGSDLASLRTKAVRDGDEWVINGQKVWTTRGHIADHVWLATRTDPDADPKHAGITVFLVPMDTPGITVQEHRALSGEISCSVFYDNVRVPDSTRIGEVNGGWGVITFALAGERIHMAGVSASVLRQLDDLLEIVHSDPDAVVGPRGSAGRATLGTMAAKLQATRVLISLAVDARATKRPDVFAPMAGVMGGELTEKFGAWIMRLLGPAATLSAGSTGAIAHGVFEAAFRLSPMYVIGGGTNDIQRSLIARGLGLPRSY